MEITSKMGPPPVFLTLSELARSSMEFGALAASFGALWAAPMGRRHKVIVLPGFALDDSSTWYLRQYLTYLGYDVHGLGLGPNYGVRTLGEDNLPLQKLIARISDGEKVSLVGHSLGGVISRAYARSYPEQIERVICLGSPIAGDESSMHSAIVWLRRKMTGEDASKTPDRTPLPVPHTVIYSETDGVVSAFDCRDDSEDADNVEVVGSHIGLVVNPQAFLAVADRLSRAA